MPSFAEQPAHLPGFELPYPPAIRRAPAPQPPDDDAVLIPPFSQARLRQAGGAAAVGGPAAAEPAFPATAGTAGPALPEAPLEAMPYAVVPEPEPAAWPATPAGEQPAGAFEPEQDLAAEVAVRLEELATELRRLGFHALLKPSSAQEPIDVVLASVIAGFLARR